ncbi:MAG: peptidylprolyl isomerase [Chitinophagaceae bacterium]|nr:peptidylprolyl isomerase [Bacteroidota bacterium]MCC6257830.1 peptidylprolyl isomerase [Chitinophagaceae bacterium]MCW5917297.1 peptidylprolyl isomerase [Ferruginibacter sp.]
MLAFVAVPVFAQPQKVLVDKIVGVVGNKIVLKSDIDNSLLDMQRQGMELPPDARCLTLEQSMGIKALVLQAEKDSIPVTDEEVETDIDNQIRYFISQYGSKDELERVAGKSVYQLKEDFKEGFRDRKLAAAMRNKIVEDVKITPNEVKAYFDKIPVDSLPLYESEVEVGQIVIHPKASREAELYCIEQLQDYKKQIENGKSFAALAALYSEDPGSKDKGGQYEINRSQRDLDPTWLAKAFTLKEGQVSNPFKTRFGYHIIQLVSRAGDEAVVRHILKVPQVTQYESRESLEKLDTVRSKLIAGTLTFGEAVNRYSDDESSKFTAGMLQGTNGTFLTMDQLDAGLVSMMNKMKVGEYSQPVEYTDDRGRKAVRIVYLKTRTEPHRENLKDDYSKIAARALEEKKEEVLEQWFDRQIKNYYIRVDDEYRDCPQMKKWFEAAESYSGSAHK